MKTATIPAPLRSCLTLTAADLMTVPVLTIPHEMCLREAARLLSESHVSGAPVVDDQGRCIGVLSSSDFVSWAGEGGKATTEKAEKVTCFIAPWGELIDIEEAADSEMRQYMTTPPVVVTAGTFIGDVAQMMFDAHIHRVLVVNDHDYPHGIVTGTDILAAVARTARSAAKGR